MKSNLIIFPPSCWLVPSPNLMNPLIVYSPLLDEWICKWNPYRYFINIQILGNNNHFYELISLKCSLYPVVFVPPGTLNSAAFGYCALKLDCIVRLITPDGIKTRTAQHKMFSEIHQRSKSLHPLGFVVYILGHNKDSRTNPEKCNPNEKPFRKKVFCSWAFLPVWVFK